MVPDRIIQLASSAIAVGGCVVGGSILPTLLRESDERGLRYTDVSVEGAPPWVAVGTAIGALRGLVVDILWIKVHWMKEKGLFYEVMADADLITKLQPWFAPVWAFHGHNMAYNISVATHTEQERWSWVQAGIRLVRNEGLRYNPNDVVLYKELAFWFAHKIEGYSDDAHLFYKRMFAQEWHFLLGNPPDSWEERTAWMKRVADAPLRVEDLVRSDAEVKALVDRLNAELTPFGEQAVFRPDRGFLTNYGLWRAVTQDSEAARLLGAEQNFRTTSPYFRVFDAIAADASTAPAFERLLACVRRSVLSTEYNMDARKMYEFTRDLGPIDWRHGQAHALYWSRLGAIRGEERSSDTENIYKVLNNDRLQLQSMQDLARWGRITYDPFSSELPARFPDSRWVETIDRVFQYYYDKYYTTRGAGGEGFIDFLRNFLSSAVREAYRSGEFERAQRLYGRLDELFGRGSPIAPNNAYARPMDVFVKEQIQDELSSQPHLAPSEATAAMRAAFRMGVGQDRRDVWDNALVFVQQVIAIFKGNEYYAYDTKFGTGRMKDLMPDFPILVRLAFIQLLGDPTIPLAEKATIWARIDQYVPTLRGEAYDAVASSLAQHLARTELAKKYKPEELFPPPPDLELARVRLAEERAAREREIAEQRARDAIMERGSEKKVERPDP